MESQDKILIPVNNSDESVEVATNALPDDVEEITQVLQAELAPLKLWLRFAVEYYRQGHHDSFQKILTPLVELYEERDGDTSALFTEYGRDESVKQQLLGVLNALAAFHTVLGSRERDKQKKKTEFEKAKRHYDLAENVSKEEYFGIGPAILHLAKGESARAEQRLKQVQDFNKNSVPRILGQACIKFNGGNFRDALKLYREVFVINPSPPPTVRLGLAYSYHKLGQTRMAQRALERTLALQEDCVEAMVGLAVVHLNEDKVEDALAMLKRAYELEPYNPSVLNHLASHYFYRAEYPKALALAQRAHKHSDSQAKAIQAESCYHIARSYHAQNDYSSALQWYTTAYKTNPDYLAPQFGLGQMHVANNDYKKATTCFERVLRAQPANVEALKVIGHLYAREGKDTEALAKLTAATEHAPGDASVWLELGKLQQRQPNQLAAALKAYEKAAGILKKGGRPVPAELWNNLGAIRHRLGKLDSAEAAYGYAIQVWSMRNAGDEFGPECISTHYNLALLYEERGEPEKAIEKYKQILQRHPNYPEAFLRLAACEEWAGRMQSAIGWAQKALMLHPKSADAYCTLGNLFLATNELKKAEQYFKTVLDLEGCDKDSYAQVQMGWIQIMFAKAANKPHEPLMRVCMPKEGESKRDGEDRIDKATEIFRTVLQQEPSNLYAANGLGVCCVAKGRLHEARQIFTQVREAGPSCEHATFNLAQLDAILQEHATATSLYESAAKKASVSRQASVRLLQARSHFDAGKLVECRQLLQRAVRLQPDSQVAWHNLGLAYLQCAKHPEHKLYAESVDTPPPRSAAAVATAKQDLALAEAIFGSESPDVALLEQAVEADRGEEEQGGKESGSASAASVAVAAGIVGASASITKAAAAFGLTSERREQALKTCAKVSRELEDEAERALAQEARFRAEAAEADKKEAEFAAAREAKRAEEAAAKKAEADAHAAAIAAQKAKLAQKLEAWREADAREAEAAASAARAKRRRKADGGDADDDDERGARAAGVEDEEPEEDDADDDDDDDPDAELFGSDDDDDDDDDEPSDAGEEGEEGEDAKAARKAAKLQRKAEKKAARKAEKKAARKAEKKAAKAAARAAAKMAIAANSGDADAEADAAEADLFGDDDDDEQQSGEPSKKGGRLAKRRKLADEAEGTPGAGDADEDDLFGDDSDAAMVDEQGATATASASAGPRKRKAVVMDDDEDD